MEELSIENILKDRIKEFNISPEKYLEKKSKDYTKRYNNGVKAFQTIINKESNKKFSFIVIKIRLQGIKEIDDLRWFYKECLKYSRKKDKFGKYNSFSKIFWGATKL